MSADDEDRFRPKPGRIRSDAPRGARPKSFFIDRQLGREVAGIVQGGSVSWQLGKLRALGL